MQRGTQIHIDERSMYVGELLGSGGEGDVLELVDPDSGARLALKWFHPQHSTPERRSQIETLVDRPAPNQRFLWPQGIVEDPVHQRFGYVMDLRPDDYVGLSDLMSGRVARKERAIVRLAFELALSFRDLHIAGLCYRDINFGNVFMDPNEGAALICDTDNVGIDGVGRSFVRGTPKFWAPEVARGDALPSKFSDRYSLAVMLFYVLLVHHPLEGRLTEQGLADAETTMRHYVFEPRFCLDPQDDSNRPDPAVHAHVEPMWDRLPRRIRDLFVRSFTLGIGEPGYRVVDTEWCDALAEMRSMVLDCTGCGRTRFLDRQDPNAPCVCGAAAEALVIEAPAGSLVVEVGARLTAHHLRHDYDFTMIKGTVEEHPTTPGVLGLRNHDDASISYRRADGYSAQVEPGQRCHLAEGAMIRFGADRSLRVVRLT